MTTAPWKFSLICASALALLLPTYAAAQTATATPAATATTKPGVTATTSATTAAPTATTTAATTTTSTPTEGAPTEDSADDASATSSTPGADETDGDAAAAGTAMDGETYRVRLRDLEQRVDELKEQIRRSHTRLSLLSDTILSGASGGARAEIEFINDLSGAWHVVEAVFVLDGAVQYKKADDTGVLAKQKRIPIFSGSIPTGDHTLQVLLKLKGHGFGVFSYLRGMEANLTTDHSFTITGGKVIELDVTAWEKGGPTTPVEQQPDIRFGQKMRSAADGPSATPAQGGAAKPSGSTSVKTENGADKGKVGGGLSVGGGASDK